MSRALAALALGCALTMVAVEFFAARWRGAALLASGFVAGWLA